MKKDSQIIGFIFGLTGPFVGCFIYYLLQFSSMTIHEFVLFVMESDSLSKVISLSAIFNLAIFFVFIYLKLDKSARGVILGTFIYVLIVILLKFV